MTSPARRPRVAVVFGGSESDRAASAATVASVLSAIDPEVFDLVPIGIGNDGRWALGSAGPQPEPEPVSEPEIACHGVGGPAEPPKLAGALVHGAGLVETPRALGEVDVVLPLLRGPWGADGTLQGLLEMAGVRYVGSGVLASAVASDREYLKLLLAAHGLPTMPYVVVRPRDWERDLSGIRAAIDALGYPCLVTPAGGRSSLDAIAVTAPDEVDAALDRAREHHSKVVVELAALDARLLGCAVLQRFDGGLDTSEVTGLVVGDGHRVGDGVRVQDGLRDEVQRRAAAAFRALGCEGFARVDLLLREDGALVVDEVDTSPDLLPSALFPMLWAESGLDYRDLVTHLVTLALSRTTGLR